MKTKLILILLLLTAIVQGQTKTVTVHQNDIIGYSYQGVNGWEPVYSSIDTIEWELYKEPEPITIMTYESLANDWREYKSECSDSLVIVDTLYSRGLDVYDMSPHRIYIGGKMEIIWGKPKPTAEGFLDWIDKNYGRKEKCLKNK